MFVRLTSIYCEDSRVEDAIACLEEIDRPAVEAAAGNRGLLTLVNRRSAVLVAASYWDALELASKATLTQARWAAADAAGGELTTETFKVGGRMHVHALSGGTVLQMYCASRAAEVGELRAMMIDSIFPLLSTCPGICQAELLRDDATGAAFLTTEWVSEQQMLHVGTRETKRLLSHVRDQLGVAFHSAGDYSVIEPPPRVRRPNGLGALLPVWLSR